MSRLSQFIIFYSALIILTSCSLQKKIGKSAKENVLATPALQTAHVGITIYEPATNKYWYDYQGDHYFVPASNTKIPTCYAAMKYLGDSLIGFKYAITDRIYMGDTSKNLPYPHTWKIMSIYPNGDPTFLLSEFHYQPMLDFLIRNKMDISISLESWQENALGSGWSWNDYEETYMAERSVMPAYGNVVGFSGKMDRLKIIPRGIIDTLENFSSGSYIKSIERSRVGNRFKIHGAESGDTAISASFDTQNGRAVAKLLSDTLKANVDIYGQSVIPFNRSTLPVIKTQPTDSLLKPMMHRSDNFFAEQSLLMVSNHLLGYMKDANIIDTLLKTDFKDLPQKPRWVDGSGLSRYNLFSPRDFVSIFNKMKNEFGMDRIKVILPTGGEGTLSSYYKAEAGYLFAKTGTLSGVVSISGFLYTEKNKLLIFSVLVNNHNYSATAVRRAVEKFLEGIRKDY